MTLVKSLHNVFIGRYRTKFVYVTVWVDAIFNYFWLLKMIMRQESTLQVLTNEKRGGLTVVSFDWSGFEPFYSLNFFFFYNGTPTIFIQKLPLNNNNNNVQKRKRYAITFPL
jgi:hypothetical protein